MILATRRLPRNTDAMALGPLILIRPECRDNEALIAHERVHQRQQRRWLWLPWFVLYLMWPKFRLRQEVEAYRTQARMKPGSAPSLARHLATAYGLRISEEQALALIAARENGGGDASETTRPS